jgi:hypothetical protein
MLAYTHGLAFLYVMILAALFPAVAANSRPWKAWRPWFVANAIVLLLFCPYVVINTQVILRVATNYWIRLEGPEPPVFSTLFYFTVFPIPPISTLLGRHLGVHVTAFLGQWVCFAPVVGVLILAVACAPAENRRAAASLLLAYTLPIFLLSAISLVGRPILIPRVLLPTVVPMVLMLGSFAASTIVRPRWRHMGLTAVLMVLLLGTFYGIRYAAKEEWRAASRYLQEHVRPKDVVLVNIWMGQFLIDRYDPRGVLRLVPKLATDELMAPLRARRGAGVS